MVLICLFSTTLIRIWGFPMLSLEPQLNFSRSLSLLCCWFVNEVTKHFLTWASTIIFGYYSYLRLSLFIGCFVSIYDLYLFRFPVLIVPIVFTLSCYDCFNFELWSSNVRFIRFELTNYCGFFWIVLTGIIFDSSFRILDSSDCSDDSYSSEDLLDFTD